MIRYVVGVALSAATAAHAAQFESSTGAYSVVASCPEAPLTGPCPTVPDSLPLQIIGNYPYVENWQRGTPGITDTALAEAGYGIGYGFVEGDSALPLPVIRALAYTPQNELGRYSVSYGSGSGIFALTYVGAKSVLFPLVGNVDFTVSFAPIDFGNPFAGGSFPYSYGEVDVRLTIMARNFDTGRPLYPADIACGVDGVLAASRSVIGRGGLASGGKTQTVSATIDAATGCDGNPFTLNPGDEIYVHAFLAAYAQRGAIVDARNTFRVDLAEGTSDEVRRQVFDNLELSVAPEPASWALMIGGFGMVGAATRMRRSRRLAEEAK